ncbi:MAG: HEPN domain-containing protein [Actinobacteria bacterium]|nr:HEPN domain-containing protein [Actinomycetota bacterium]
MIILYGSYARGDWVDGPHQQGHGRLTIEKKSDYDILVITQYQVTAENTAVLQGLQNEFAGLNLSTHVRLIAHDIKFIKKLREGQYFFSDIRKEGIALYHSEAFNFPQQVRVALLDGERKQIAQTYFDHWLTSAKQFYSLFETALEKGWCKIAAFNLNQATEHAYKALLLVFTHYCPDEHYLDALDKRAVRQAPDLYDVFPKDTLKEQELFELLDYAYIGARYDPKYTITKEQLEQLAACVRKLHEIIEQVCRDKITSLG